MHLSTFHTQFVCLLKFNPEHANSFDLRDFAYFLLLPIFNILFTLPGHPKRPNTPAAPSRQAPLLPRKRSWRSSPMHWPRRLRRRPSSRPRCPPRRQPAPTPPLTPNAATVDSASSTSESMPRRCRCRHHAGPTR